MHSLPGRWSCRGWVNRYRRATKGIAVARFPRMNKPVSIAIFISLALFADRRIFAAKPLVFSSEMAGKPPATDDRDKDEDDDPGSKKSKIAEPSPTPIDQGQTESKPNGAKENEFKEPRSSPSDQDRNENSGKKSSEPAVKEPNDMSRVDPHSNNTPTPPLTTDVADP